MEDTPMMAQGLRYSWADRLVMVRDERDRKAEYMTEWPTPGEPGVCPVCHPISKERMEALGEDGVMSPRLCHDRWAYRARQHAEYIRREASRV